MISARNGADSGSKHEAIAENVPAVSQACARRAFYAFDVSGEDKQSPHGLHLSHQQPKALLEVPLIKSFILKLAKLNRTRVEQFILGITLQLRLEAVAE